MKLLHYGDQHLGEKDSDEAEKCLDFVRDTAAKESVDLIISAGDLFDSQDTKLDSKAARLAVRHVSEMAEIAPVAMVLGTYSHDGKAAEILAYVRGRFPVHVATRPEQIEIAGAVLTLIPAPTKQYFQSNGDIRTTDQEIGTAMSALFGGFGAQAAEHKVPHLLVYHGGISGAKVSTGQTLTGQEIEVSLDQLALAGATLNLCGHIHLPQQVGGGRTFYAGSIYPNNWGENHRHGFYLFDLGKEGQIERRFVDTPHRKLMRVENDFTTCGPIEELAYFLSSTCFDPQKVEGAFVRCDFKVFQDEAGKLDREKIREFYLSVGALDVDIRIIRVPRETVRAESVLKAEKLRDKLQAMAALKEETVAESVLAKADALEDKQAEDLLAEVGGNGKVAG